MSVHDGSRKTGPVVCSPLVHLLSLEKAGSSPKWTEEAAHPALSSTQDGWSIGVMQHAHTTQLGGKGQLAQLARAVRQG